MKDGKGCHRLVDKLQLHYSGWEGMTLNNESIKLKSVMILPEDKDNSFLSRQHL